MEHLYTSKFGTGTTIKTLGWGSTYSQEIRFRILLEIPGFSQSDTVLDVGCGYGDLSLYIQNYTGIDIRQRAIDEARNRYPTKSFQTNSIENITQSYDWIFASGIFAFNTETWKEDTLRILTQMVHKSKKGIAFNVLSSLTPNKKDEDMKYVTTTEITDLIQTISNKFIIRHDYLPNDLTIYLFA